MAIFNFITAIFNFITASSNILTKSQKKSSYMFAVSNSE